MTRSYLSKSKLMSARQCLKRLYFEVYRPDLADVSSRTEAAFRIGHEVGEIAHRIYGNGAAYHVAYDDELDRALEETARLVLAGPRAPIFEATFQHDGVLVRVSELLPLVPEWVAEARNALVADQPVLGVGRHCFHPFSCPFAAHCWPSDSDYPVLDLGGGKAALGEFVADGYRDLRDVPAERLTEKQRRMQRIAKSGEAELLPAAAGAIAALGYPRYYLDFETIMPPVPIWAGTRPYETLPFQWSCHYESAPSDLRHADFLDLSGAPPMRRFAESMIRALGREGPILVYTSYEMTVINRLIERFPDLEAPLAAVIGRLVNLRPIAEQNFYHPSMRGSWSLKAMLPLIAADLRYSELEGIQEGRAASEGYLEAIHPATVPARKEMLRQQLQRYCRMDTEALVRLVRFLGGEGGAVNEPGS